MDTDNKKDAAEALDVRASYASVTVVVSDDGTPKAVGRNAKEAWGSFDLEYSWRANRRYYLGQGWRTVRYFKHNNRSSATPEKDI
jgi:hypothetical protein